MLKSNNYEMSRCILIMHGSSCALTALQAAPSDYRWRRSTTPSSSDLDLHCSKFRWKWRGCFLSTTILYVGPSVEFHLNLGVGANLSLGYTRKGFEVERLVAFSRGFFRAKLPLNRSSRLCLCSTWKRHGYHPDPCWAPT